MSERWSTIIALLLIFGAPAAAQDLSSDPYCELRCTEYGLQTHACDDCSANASPVPHPSPPPLPSGTSVANVVCPAANNAVIPANECYNQMVVNYNQRVNQFNNNVGAANAWVANEKNAIRQQCLQILQIIADNHLTAAVAPTCN